MFNLMYGRGCIPIHRVTDLTFTISFFSRCLGDIHRNGFSCNIAFTFDFRLCRRWLSLRVSKMIRWLKFSRWLSLKQFCHENFIKNRLFTIWLKWLTFFVSCFRRDSIVFRYPFSLCLKMRIISLMSINCYSSTVVEGNFCSIQKWLQSVYCWKIFHFHAIGDRVCLNWCTYSDLESENFQKTF